LCQFKPQIVKAVHAEQWRDLVEESMTQRQVVEAYNMRKIENVGGGYYKMLEKGHSRKRQGIVGKKHGR
jgi:hypothetical protein